MCSSDLVSTHLSRFEGEWWKVIAIWEGGLALFGGLTVGTLTAVYLIRRRGGNAWKLIDAAAVGIPAAQAIGRWGNYFNQELFGTPSTLPWAVEIAPGRRPAEFAEFETFHPTFLYESLWNALFVIPALLWIERRFKLPTGGLFMVYAALYGVGRFALELIRTDTSFRLLGLSRNGWVSLAVVIGALVLLAAEVTGAPLGDVKHPVRPEDTHVEVGVLVPNPFETAKRDLGPDSSGVPRRKCEADAHLHANVDVRERAEFFDDALDLPFLLELRSELPSEVLERVRTGLTDLGHRDDRQARFARTDFILQGAHEVAGTRRQIGRAHV